MPMVLWLRLTSGQAQKRAMQATAQATAYSTAMATTPPIAEIELNHVTHAVLEATNFLGINTIPIGFNEVRLLRPHVEPGRGDDAHLSGRDRLQPHVEPITTTKPVVIPGAEGAAMAAMGQIAAMAPGAAFRKAAFAHVSGQATVESAASAGRTRGRQGQHGGAACRRRGPKGRQRPAGGRSRTRGCSRACRRACRWPASSDPCWASSRSRPARWSASRCSS